jgi:hypothetical protein
MLLMMSWNQASPAKYQMLPKISKLRYQIKLEKFTSEWKPVSEKQWAKNDEWKWSERKRTLHPLVTMDTHSLCREVPNNMILYEKTLKCVFDGECNFIAWAQREVKRHRGICTGSFHYKWLYHCRWLCAKL